MEILTLLCGGHVARTDAEIPEALALSTLFRVATDNGGEQFLDLRSWEILAIEF